MKNMIETIKFIKQTRKPIDRILYKEYLNGVTTEELSEKYNVSPRYVNFKINKEKIIGEHKDIYDTL